LDGWKSRSGRGSVAFDCDDAMSSGDGFERDIIMEFVIQDEIERQKRFHSYQSLHRFSSIVDCTGMKT
jgi:hypothetical protein